MSVVEDNCTLPNEVNNEVRAKQPDELSKAPTSFRNSDAPAKLTEMNNEIRAEQIKQSSDAPASEAGSHHCSERSENNEIRRSSDTPATLTERNTDRLYIHIPINYKREKALLTYSIIHKLLLGYIEKINITDRDHYGNKRIYNVYQYMMIQFLRSFEELKISFLKEKIINIDKRDIYKLFDRSINILSMKSPLSINQWRGRPNQCVSQIKDSINYYGFISLISKINTPVRNESNRVDKQRDMHMTQSNILCPYETPSDKKVGLSKYTSIQSILSLDQSVEFKDFFDHLGERKLSVDKYLLLINH